jgi:hypothetical protein
LGILDWQEMALSLKQIIVLYSYNASNKMYQRGDVDNSME